jgi:chaperonin cofactor prefoldin
LKNKIEDLEIDITNLEVQLNMADEKITQLEAELNGGEE